MAHTCGHSLKHGVMGTLPRIRNGQVTPQGRRVPNHEFACLSGGLGFVTLQYGESDSGAYESTFRRLIMREHNAVIVELPLRKELINHVLKRAIDVGIEPRQGGDLVPPC